MRTVSVEETVAGKHLAGLYGRVGWEAGLLIGRLGSKERDHIVYLAAMPGDPKRDHKPRIVRLVSLAYTSSFINLIIKNIHRPLQTS